MLFIRKSLFVLCLSVLGCATILAQEICPVRPNGGSIVGEPAQLLSQNGKLTVDMTVVSSLDVDGTTNYCFRYSASIEAPTLMVNPGDVITFNLTNHLPATTESAMVMKHSMHMLAAAAVDGASAKADATKPDAIKPDAGNPCNFGAMTSSSTNVHFHGLNIPPRCHQDEVIKTTVQPNDPPFQYSFQVPANEPPGLYWYHPHPHGMTLTQVLGGASGAIIVNGIEKFRPEVIGLKQRVFIIRQKQTPGVGEESTVLSVNFVPAYTHIASTIQTKPAEKQFWRVVNSSAKFFLTLQLQSHGAAKPLKLIAFDGVPLSAARDVKKVTIPPAGRVEFIMQGPPLSASEQFMNLAYNTGPTGDLNTESLLANVLPTAPAVSVPAATAASISASISASTPATDKPAVPQRFAGLAAQSPVKTRHLYFSESDDGTQFFITVEGQTPKIYEPDDAPSIITQQGTVEDWIIENHTTEVHAFHIHQIHFLQLEQNGVAIHDSALRDTIVVPFWDGVRAKYPQVKVRVDFRDPEIVGTFLYHCHILDHEDGGMMAKIQVLPSN